MAKFVFDRIVTGEELKGLIQDDQDPEYLEIYLVAPEESNGQLLVSGSSTRLSNVVRVAVTP